MRSQARGSWRKDAQGKKLASVASTGEILFSWALDRGYSHACLELERQLRFSVPHNDRPRVVHWTAYLSVAEDCERACGHIVRSIVQTKTYEGQTVRRTYDAAKTPLQRLLLPGVLPGSQQQELSARARDLDPVRLFQQLQDAVFRCAVGVSPAEQRTAASSLLLFEHDRQIATEHI